MRSFQGRPTLDPVPGDVVARLGRIDRAAGGEARHLDQLPQLLDALREQARVESVTASNAIEGVRVEGARASGILSGRAARLRNRSEAEFAGYTAALDYLYRDDPGDLTVGLLLHLHRLLFSRGNDEGGRFKERENLVVDRGPDGTRTVRFRPVSPHETPYYVSELVDRTREALDRRNDHPLLVVAAFVLDLLCVHPFDDGNGRVARLATTHLLDRAGYRIGRYVSIEQLFYDTQDTYYAVLAASTDGWFDEGSHRLWPWAGYFLGRLELAYERFEARVAAGTSGGSKQGRVRDFVLLHAPARFTIADVRRALPGISDKTIRLVLADMRDREQLAKEGSGRGANWRRAVAARAD